jgi:hypothetical protein
LSPRDQGTTRSQLPEAAARPEDLEPLDAEPMEVDALDPPPPRGFRPYNARSTTSVRYSTMPR